MPLFTPEGTRLPTGDDNYDLTNDLRRMMDSTTTVIVAANEAARLALPAAFVAYGQPISRDQPIYVHQSDTGTLWMNDSTGWVTPTAPELLTSGAPSGGTTVDSKVLVTINIPATPYGRRVVMTGMIYGSAIVGQWDGAMSLGISNVADSQRFARFPIPATSASVAMSYSDTLAANTASTARLWVSRVSAAGSGATINISGSISRVNLDVQMFRV